MEARALHEQQRVNHQAELDAWWAGLNANNADIVLNALAAAFEDNEAAAAPVGIDNGEISVVVFVPSTDAIPERKPTTTAAGNLSLKKLTKSEIASFYKYLVYGHTLVTVKETLAVAPQATAVRIAAVRLSDTDSYGRRRPEVILAAKFERSRIAGVRWQHADSEQIVNDTNSILLLKQKGATKELHPLNLNEEPELASLLPAVDFSETTSAG